MNQRNQCEPMTAQPAYPMQITRPDPVISNSDGLTLSIHADFPVHDFPRWFENFFNEQADGIQCRSEYFSAMPMAQLQITYIKLWSVIESFAKIVFLLAEKRHCLKELSPEINRIERIQTQLERYKNDVHAALNFYQQSINADSTRNTDALTDIAAVKIDFKRRELKQFSVDKSVVFKEKLPNKTVMDKALSTLELKVVGFSDVLNDGSKNSNYYTTRNHIAHEGKSDITAAALIEKRIMPLLTVIKQIKDYLEQPVFAKKIAPAVGEQPHSTNEVAQ
ncbi:hypothetical protein [Shewanella sp.]|uniref:hypothetical protein n=1 Tax=Shewanella sp. TaxID=50422 RepID=UPI003F35148A